MIFNTTFEEDVEAIDPLVLGDLAVIVVIEVFEHPVHEDVIRHLEAAVEELPEHLPVHQTPGAASVSLLATGSVKFQAVRTHGLPREPIFSFAGSTNTKISHF